MHPFRSIGLLSIGAALLLTSCVDYGFGQRYILTLRPGQESPVQSPQVAISLYLQRNGFQDRYVEDEGAAYWSNPDGGFPTVTVTQVREHYHLISFFTGLTSRRGAEAAEEFARELIDYLKSELGDDFIVSIVLN